MTLPPCIGSRVKIATGHGETEFLAVPGIVVEVDLKRKLAIVAFAGTSVPLDWEDLEYVGEPPDDSRPPSPRYEYKEVTRKLTELPFEGRLTASLREYTNQGWRIRVVLDRPPYLWVLLERRLP